MNSIKQTSSAVQTIMISKTSSQESYHNKIGHTPPRELVRELSPLDNTTPSGTPSSSHPPAPRLSPQHIRDNNNIEDDDSVSLTLAENSVSSTAENLDHVFNRILGPCNYSIIVHDGDIPLHPIEIDLIEEERARANVAVSNRVFARTLMETSKDRPWNDYAGGGRWNDYEAHCSRCAWHGISLAKARTSNDPQPLVCICETHDGDGIVGQDSATASSVPRRPPAARVHTHNIAKRFLCGASVTENVPGSLFDRTYCPDDSDWLAESLATIHVSLPNNPKRYPDEQFPSHIHQPLRPGYESVQDFSREPETQSQANSLAERGSLNFAAGLNSNVDTAKNGRLETPSVISIHSVSPQASVCLEGSKSTFMIDNSPINEHLRNVAILDGVTGYASPSTNRARDRSCEHRESSTHHSFSSLSYFTHLTVDTSLKTKNCCLVILFIFLALIGTVLWLMAVKRMHVIVGIFCLFVLAVATLKLGYECCRAFGWKKRELSDLERSIGVGQKNVASLI